MRFRHPAEDIEFDIPDPWWIEANAHLFERSAPSFAASMDAEWPTVLVSIENVTAPRRNAGIEGLQRERTISILQAIVAGTEVAPLEVHKPPQSNCLAVRDGFHRYFISIAFGFPMLPVSIRPYFDFHAL